MKVIEHQLIERKFASGRRLPSERGPVRHGPQIAAIIVYLEGVAVFGAVGVSAEVTAST